MLDKTLPAAREKVVAALWWLLLLAFAGTGLWAISDKPEWDLPLALGEWVTTDSMLRSIAPDAPSSETLLSFVSQVPEGKPILFAGSGDPGQLRLMFYLLGYFAWPRPVWFLPCRPVKGIPTWPHDSPSAGEVGAVVLFNVSPRHWAPVAQALSPSLMLLPAGAGKEWNLFCP